ncbi:MAG: MG2 domain-containing protein [Candidatus Gracilibacteria bacterium]|nr:MG2 domain-containing protein [Candidatus Gracilibacteria bacterium]
MVKCKEIKSKMVDLIKNYKIISGVVLGIFVLAIFSLVYIFNKETITKTFNNIVAQKFIAFEVNGGNFDLGIKKIPYNVKSIDISFSKGLDEKSLGKDIFKIIPEVPGIVKLKDKNTISYELTQNLEIGKDYTISISKNIKSVSGETFSDDILYIVSVVPGAKVVKFLPENKLEDITKNIGVFFSIPMVALTDLDSRDKLPCPLEITPKVDGKCVWTTTSVLEFIPKKGFEGATKYDYKVSSKSGMNYLLEKDLTGSFTTPELQPLLSDTFVPKNYINLNFNYPVSVEELNKNLNLYISNNNVNTLPVPQTNTNSGQLISNKTELKYKIEPIKNSETSFLIKPISGEFTYSTSYEIKIKSGLKPKYGNITLKDNFEKYISSTSLVSNIDIYKNIYSDTGALIDTQTFTYQSYLPNKDIFFKINFFEEMSLIKDLFNIKNDKTGKNIDFDISYIKKEIEENGKTITVDDKTSIKLEIKNPLENNYNYSLNILKKSNPSLIDNIVYNYQTSPELKVTNYKFIDYSKSCIYVNNELDYYDGNLNKYFSLSSSGIIKNVDEGNYIEDRNFERTLDGLTQNERNKKLLEKGYCPEAGTGEILYAIDTRLVPNASYDFGTNKLQDIYGNTLKQDFRQTIKTGNLKEKDKYVYTSFTNNTNVFPKNIPVVLNIQTINTPKTLVEVCQMDERNYISYLKNIYIENYIPVCNNFITKSLDTKVIYWKLTNNRFDLEKDILGEKLNQDYALVSIYSNVDKNISTSKSINIIARTNMSLFVEKATNKSLIYATDLETNKEIEDLKIEFYDYKGNEVSLKYSFDKNKKVYIVDNDLVNIFYIVAKNDKFSSIVMENDQFSNYDFKYISGQDSSTKDFAYIYSDRPIYRPGDEVQIKGLLREFNFDGFKKSKIEYGTIKIIGEDWTVYRSIDVGVDENSNFNGSFIIPKDSSLGNFRFQFSYTVDGQYYDNDIYSNGGFSIEQYRKPSFKVNIDSPKNDVSLGEKVSFKITPKYYFGGSMVNTSGKYSILTQNYFFDGKQYSDYQFGIGNNYFDCIYWGYCNYGDNLNSGATDFKVNENGEFNLDYTFGTGEENAEKIYTFSFDVVDPDTSKTVSNSVSKVLHTTDNYVGLKANYYNSLKKGIYFQAVSLDYNAKPVPNKNLKIEITKKEYKQVKKLGVDGVFYNDYSIEDTLESTLNLSTDDKGMLKYNAKTKGSGEYEIKITYTGNNKKSFISSQTVYVAGDDYVSWGDDNNSVTDLEADKITYKLGETATFTLKSPVNNGKALIVVEKDDGILDYFVHDIKSYGDEIKLKLTDKYYPNVYLKAYLIGSQKDNPLPVFKRALSVVKVLTDYKKLNVSIITDKKNYKPADKMQVTVEVVDINGKVVPNANGSLSVVDESVLALKGNPKKNPYSFFYDMKRYLGVVSYSNLKYLIDKLEVKDVSGGEKGGAGDQVKGGETKKPRGNFKDTAFWLSDFTTDKNGKAIITIPVMPDNLTTWVLEALVSTPEDNKIGVNYETVMTATEVMVEDNLPRFLGTDDKITFSPVIYNRTGKDDTFKISFKASNGNLAETEKTVLIKSGESQKVEFNFSVESTKDFKQSDVSKINIEAVSVSNKDKYDSIQKFIPIQVGTIAENTSTVGKTTKVSFDEKISLGNVIKDNAKMTLNYGGTLFSYLLDGIAYLAQYPYGCSEQRTSSIMPNIYIKKLYDIAGVPFDLKKKMVKKYIDNEIGYKDVSVDEAIKDYLIEIKKFQNDDGGFVYWSDIEYKWSDLHLTNYILTSLSEIKSLGYDIDKNVLNNAKNYLKNEFYKRPVCVSAFYIENCISLSLKSQMLLALNSYDNKDYEVYKMFKTLNIEKLDNLTKADLISKISNISSLSKTESDKLKKESQDIISKVLSNELVFNPRGAFISASYNSRIYNTAKLLEIIGNIGLDKFKDVETITDNMIRFISGSKMNDAFGSTYDNSYVIKSLTSYLSQTNELKDTNFFARFNLNSVEIETKKIDKSNIFESFTKSFDLKDLHNSNTFNIEKDGSGSVYYDLSLKYFVPTKELKPRDEGFFIEKKYFLFNEYKKIEALKAQEYAKYLSGEIIYENLKYPREVIEYLTPITFGKVGELVLVHNKLITSEDRDQVALESYIPAGSEIVNTNLATEDKTITDVATNIYLDRKEFRDNEYFAWIRQLRAGIYNFSYTIRLTHNGIFEVKPTQVSEFYTPEVFGRTSGEEFRVE